MGLHLKSVEQWKKSPVPTIKARCSVRGLFQGKDMTEVYCKGTGLASGRFLPRLQEDFLPATDTGVFRAATEVPQIILTLVSW